MTTTSAAMTHDGEFDAALSYVAAEAMYDVLMNGDKAVNRHGIVHRNSTVAELEAVGVALEHEVSR
jgi:hypothetical protein